MLWCSVLRRAGSDYCVHDINPGNFADFAEMFWCSVLRRAGSDYCVHDISTGSFADFRLKISTQEKISSYGDPCP